MTSPLKKRRTILLGMGSGTVLALAGCIDGDDDLGEDDETADDGDSEADEIEDGTDETTDQDNADADSDDGDDEDTPEEPDDEDANDETADDIPAEEDLDIPETLPTDPDPDNFVDKTGQDTVEILTLQLTGREPQFVFYPPFVRVDQGTTIEWVNADGIFHTVTSTPNLDNRSGGGEAFDEVVASEGDSFEWEAAETGRQSYYCSPHAGFMFGAVEIE